MGDPLNSAFIGSLSVEEGKTGRRTLSKSAFALAKESERAIGVRRQSSGENFR